MSLQVPGPALLSSSTVDSPASGGAATFSSITDTGLTAGRVVYTGTGGLLSASADFTYSGGTSVALSNNVTSGLQIYNTADQTTNFERMEFLWTGNVATIRTAKGGSAQQRSVSLVSGNPSMVVASGATFDVRTEGGATALTNQMTVRPFSASTITSGTYVQLAITPTYNQASGNAANTDVAIARVETAVGSGTQNFITCAAGVAGTTQIFAFGTTGILTKPGGTIPLITTSSAITTGAAAQIGTLTNAPVAGNPTKWCAINDNGTTRYVPAW